MYARVATFQGDPAGVDEAIASVRAEVEADEAPPGLEGAKDEALNAMSPASDGQRTSVECYEVPVQTMT